MDIAQGRWFDDYHKVLAVGRYLVEHEKFTASELLTYFEKPWKWEDAYMAMSKIHWAPYVRGDGDGMPF
jgi:hypothetical protein